MKLRDPLALPDAGGTYCLVLYNRRGWQDRIGRLEDCRFIRGWYLYVGSAFGPGGLRGRLRHHLGVSERPHWHIDYLRRRMALREIWCCVSADRLETQWAATLGGMSGMQVPVAGLGASDSRADSHLFYASGRPDFTHIGARLAASAATPLTRFPVPSDD